MKERSTDDLLTHLELLMERDDWEDYKQISKLFEELGERALTFEQFGKYNFYLSQF